VLALALVLAPLRRRQRHAGIAHRQRRRELGRDAGVRGRLEAGGQPDQRGLAERGAEEADAERHPEHDARRYLDDRIAGRRRQARASEDEVVGAMRSVVQAGGSVGATTASRLYLLSARSMPLTPAFWSMSRAWL